MVKSPYFTTQFSSIESKAAELTQLSTIRTEFYDTIHLIGCSKHIDGNYKTHIAKHQIVNRTLMEDLIGSK